MNKLILSTLLGVTFLVPTLSFACKGTQLIYEDSFATLNSAFANADNSRSVKDGKLTVAAKMNTVNSLQYQSDFFSNDADLCVKAKVVESKDTGADATPLASGIEYWAKSYNDYYLFWVSPISGKFGVSRYLEGRWASPVASQENAAILKGIGQDNSLRVVLQGNQATFFVNDKQVATAQGQPPAGGSFFGMYAEGAAKSNTTWEFSGFKVTK